MVGQTVGKYRIVSRLGRGGMGTVYKAVDETLGREVALKCLNTDITDADLLKRFRAEAIMLGRLNHPNIATLFELATHDGRLVMVMEFVRGETFDQLSQREGPMAVDRASQLCAQVLEALEHAHREGIVHRDLKPSNLMLTAAGLVKVMDFGLARMVGTEHLTNDGYMVGTPAYMSPEQVLGRDIDGRADVYAMGVVLFRLLTSQLPFKADSGIAMVHRQINDAPTPVRQLRSELSETCEEILSRALEKQPESRFQSADEFRSALTRINPSLPASGVSRIAVGTGSSGEGPAEEAPTAFTPKAIPAIPAPNTVVLPRGGAPPVTRRTRLEPRVVATIAVLAVLVTGIPISALLWWATHRTPPPAPAPAALAAPVNSSPAPSSATPSTAPPPPAPTSRAAKNKPAAGSPASTAPEPALPVLPVVTIGKIKLLVIDDTKSRDRDATLRLGADGLEVVDGAQMLERAQYTDVIGVFYSHSKEPRWALADGQTAPVVKTAGGMFGFLKGTPDWITVRTKRLFIPMRVNEGDVAFVTRELEARTGARVVQIR